MVYILRLPIKPSQTLQYINEQRNEFEKLKKTKILNIRICNLTNVNIEKKEYFKDGIHIKTSRKQELVKDILQKIGFGEP
jgi:hypothetical protein